MTTLTLEEVSALHSNDVASLMGVKATVADSGKHLEDYYRENSRSVRKYSKPEYGKFWDKVEEIAALLDGAKEWPLPPLMVKRGTLYDGHHRANAAIKVGWDKPIPTTESWMGSGW